MICLCLTGNSLESWTEQLQRNLPWISLAELRVDLLKPAERSPAMIAAWWREINPGIPAVVTIRRTRDLGCWEGDEAQRAFLLEQLVEVLAPQYVDLELDRRGQTEWDRIALRVRAGGGAVVRSHHEPREMPGELSQLMARLAVEAREIPKLAVSVASAAECMQLLQDADRFRQMMPGRRAVWIGMGEHGMLSRVFPARFHSAWTYGFDGEGEAIAPGQVAVRHLHEVYRVGQVEADWQSYAVVGAPVVHSRSPEYHNRRFAAAGCRKIYLPIRIDRFDEFPEVADTIPLTGVSVTVPHKEAACAFAGQPDQAGVSPEAERVGAANTLVFTGSAGWYADNTDVAGFLGPIRDLPPATPVAVIGAGGAARAIVAGLLSREAVVDVFNRTRSKAESLVHDLGLPAERAHALNELADWSGPEFGLLVQTTSVGMDGFEGDPIPFFHFTGRETVYDVVYTPPVTPLLARAEAAGCDTINGQAMFDLQADYQYRSFTADVTASH